MLSEHVCLLALKYFREYQKGCVGLEAKCKKPKLFPFYDFPLDIFQFKNLVKFDMINVLHLVYFKIEDLVGQSQSIVMSKVEKQIPIIKINYLPVQNKPDPPLCL